MNNRILRKKLFRALSSLGSAGCLLATTPFAQAQAITGFNDGGWNADDVRNASGENISHPHTHAPAANTTLDPFAVGQQIDWLNKSTTFGNLGGVRFDPTANAGGKATLSTVNTTTGFGRLGTVAAGSDFGITYAWSRDANLTPGVSFRLGVQTANYADAQDSFTATRSGEAGWDLILVYDPSNNNNSTGTGPSASVIDLNNGKFNLFSQAGNAYWDEASGENNTDLGVGLAQARTLAEWLADDYWGPILSASNITNTQFGMGSGNAGALATLDWAEISFLGDGGRLDFVDAARYTGGGTNPAAYHDAANWDGVAPSSEQNLVVENDATLEVSGTQHTRSLGILGGATGLVLQDGATLVLNAAENGTLSAAPDATLNVSGPGTLQASLIEAGGTINLASIVRLDGGDNAHPVRDGAPTATSRYGLVVHQGGTVNLLSGADVTLTNHTGVAGLKTLIRVGELSTIDGPGVLNISAGARLSAGSLHGSNSWGALHVGDWGGQGQINQTGGAVDLFGAIVIGNEGGIGVYNLSGGTIDLRRPVGDNAALIIGRATNHRTGHGTLNVSGGTLTLGAESAAPGNVAMILGGLSDNVAAYANATGIVNQTGGVVRFENAILKFGRGDGTYNLDGGFLEIGGTNAITATPGGSYAFNFGGGTLRLIDHLTTSIDMRVVDNNPNTGGGAANVTTSFIDTNGYNATFSGSLTGEGILEKHGLGTLTLSGSNHLDGEFYVVGGVVEQVAGDSVIDYFGVGSGTTDGNIHVGTFDMIDGSLTITRALQVGDWGGDGTFNQTGGSVVVGRVGAGASFNIGNQGGNGVYNLSGGAFTIHEGFANLGRSDRNVAGDGELNISGDAIFTVGDRGDLIIGDREGSGANGNGVVNQTGGLLRVTGDGELWIGSYGNGTYNLFGGALEIGGASLRANYGGGAGASVFNIGGGTIRVIEEDLITSVRGVLLADTVSTIDTNGFNAVFSRGFEGSGGFDKIGVGALTLNGVTDLASDSSVDGVLKIGAGNNQTGTLNLTAGLTLKVVDGVSRLQVGVDGGTGTANFNEGAFLVVDSTNAGPNTWATLDVGRGAGANGLLNHSSGLVDLGGGALQIGYSGGHGAYHLTDDAELKLGSGSSLFIGSGDGANGLLTIADDAVFSSDGQVFIGAGIDALGTITQTGGEATFTGSAVWFGTNSDETTNSPGTGIYNLSGGRLSFIDVEQGVRFGDSNGGSGEFNQSGGSVTFTNTTLSIGAYGTYNHTGGVLEIGGINLTGAGVYNLGGGTVRVTGANLAAGAQTRLVADTTSHIDTAGFDAVFTSITGPGHLVKTGDGKLRVEHAEIGDFVAEQGHSEFGEASSFESITVNRGATFSALEGVFLDGGAVTLEFANLSEYSFLTLGGDVVLNGTLAISLVEAFSFVLGDSLHVFRYDGLESIDLSTFFVADLPWLGEGLYWDDSELATAGTLTVAAVPEPATIAMLAGLGALTFAAGRRRRG